MWFHILSNIEQVLKADSSGTHKVGGTLVGQAILHMHILVKVNPGVGIPCVITQVELPHPPPSKYGAERLSSTFPSLNVHFWFSQLQKFLSSLTWKEDHLHNCITQTTSPHIN